MRSAIFVLLFSLTLFLQGCNRGEEIEIEKNNPDLLQRISEENAWKQSMLSADFITAEVYEYKGTVSDSLESCIGDIEWKTNMVEGRLSASFNGDGDFSQWKRGDGSLDKKKIGDEIYEVFGEAIKRSSLNWVWDGEKKRYSFFMPEGDESLWYCYFLEETDFFQIFLKDVSFVYKEEDHSDIVDLLMPSTAPTPSITATTTTSIKLLHCRVKFTF
jgi:hypothetical protein